MTVSLEHGLTDAQQLRAYRRSGFVVLDGLFSLDEVAQMRTEADRILDVVRKAGLRPPDVDTKPVCKITPDDLGVVCYQVVLPPAAGKAAAEAAIEG